MCTRVGPISHLFVLECTLEVLTPFQCIAIRMRSLDCHLNALWIHPWGIGMLEFSVLICCISSTSLGESFLLSRKWRSNGINTLHRETGTSICVLSLFCCLNYQPWQGQWNFVQIFHVQSKCHSVQTHVICCPITYKKFMSVCKPTCLGMSLSLYSGTLKVQ